MLHVGPEISDKSVVVEKVAVTSRTVRWMIDLAGVVGFSRC